jgi:hypothetical protein
LGDRSDLLQLVATIWRGEDEEEMMRVFGQEFPKKGMLLAMGTHSLRPDQWLINGVIRLDDVEQLTLL